MEDDINYFRAEVRTSSRLTPNMIRVIFGGADLARSPAAAAPTNGWWWPSPTRDRRLRPDDSRAAQLHRPAPGTQVTGRPDRSTSSPTRAESPPSGRCGRAVGDVVYLTDARGWYDPPDDCAGSCWSPT